MVHHIVMWKFKPEIEENKKEELKKAMEENLTALVGKIPGLLTLEFVACPFGSSTHDMALVSTFEKEEDISVYAKHDCLNILFLSQSHLPAEAAPPNVGLPSFLL